MKYHVEWAGNTHIVEIRQKRGETTVTVDGTPYPADVASVEGGDLLNLLFEGNSATYAARFENGSAVLSFHDREVRVPIEDERTRLAREATGGRGPSKAKSDIQSVMPGVVKEIRVAVGDPVESGQPLLILEAMKMENEIRAPMAGIVKKVHVEAGQAVEKGAELLALGAAAE